MLDMQVFREEVEKIQEVQQVTGLSDGEPHEHFALLTVKEVAFFRCSSRKILTEWNS